MTHTSRRRTDHERDSGYLVSIHELPRREGASLPLRLTLPALAEMGTDVIAVPQGSELTFDGLLESVSEGVLITGRIEAVAHGECVRCLTEVDVPVAAEAVELVYYPERARAAIESGEDEDDIRVLDGDSLDLSGPFRDALVPQLPFQPLCRADCPGLCPDCGIRLADQPGHHHERIDQRFAALEALRSQVPLGDAQASPEHVASVRKPGER